jgi:2-methylfumaryl-CoA isomerase
MFPLLKGLRIVEGASFIAAPLCGLTFAQLGADVIRFDQIGGGPDFRRWPLADNGVSLYWEGLNKGKRSIALDLSRPEGREIAQAIVTAPGAQAGLFVTNYPHEGFLSHERLARRRADLLTLRVTGSSDGTSGFDYTVNSAAGFPLITGPEDHPGPVNHVLPAWDISCGLMAAVTLLAAEHERSRSGIGRELRIALSDVAFTTLGHLGQIAEIELGGEDRRKIGNALYGAFGRDFQSADGRRVMIAAITRKQWTSLLNVLGIGEAVAALERHHGVDLGADEGARFTLRAELFPLVERAVSALHYDTLVKRFDEAGVCWGPYRTVREALREDARLSEANPVFRRVTHGSGKTYLTPGFGASIGGIDREPPRAAPVLGEHTEAVLAEVLGLSDGEIGRLHDAKLVASSQPAGRRNEQ